MTSPTTTDVPPDERNATIGVYPSQGGALGGALTSIGIPKEGVPRYETDLKADKWLLIAHGTNEDVERARELMATGSPERIDVHASRVTV